MERDSIITAWESMTGKEQHDMIAACVYQVAQREHGVQALYQHGHSIDEYISEAWLKLTETMTAGEVEQINAQRQQDGKKPITLISMVYRAVRASMSAVVRADRITGQQGWRGACPRARGQEGQHRGRYYSG